MAHNEQKQVVIIGAGIIGVNIGYQLVKAGARVTILDKDQPARGATANSFAWINASRGKRPRHYYDLNRLGIAAWHLLDKELAGALQVTWGGSLEWFHDAEKVDAVREQTRRHLSWGYPIRPVDRRVCQLLEANVSYGPVMAAFHGEAEGHIDPVFTTQALLQAAQALGARLVSNCTVKEITSVGDRITGIVTSQGEFAADTVVVAAGTGTPAVAALAGVEVPLKPSPGVLTHTRPTTALIERVVLSPHGHMKQKRDGRIVVGASFQGTEGTDHSPETGRSQLDHAAHSLPHLADLEVEKMTLGWRVLPQDDLPIIGYTKAVPNLYVAAMHSGITLGPLVGQLAATEIAAEVEVETLRHYRLERFG